MSEVLVGYDGRDGGHDAIALTRALCEALGARPVVVIAVPFPDDMLGRRDLQQVLEAADRHLSDAAAALDGLEPEVRTAVERSPAKALHDLSEERDPLAVVAGSSHRGAAGSVLLGTTGVNLLAGSTAPIAIAPRGYASAGHRRLQRIGVAIDGGEECWNALRSAVAIAERTAGNLEILGAVAPTSYGYAEAFELIGASEYEDALRRQMDGFLDRARSLVPADVGAETRMLVGEPSQVIADAAEDLDILVVGSRAYGPLRRVLLGSVSAALLRHAPCPVLVMPRRSEPLGSEPRLDAAGSTVSSGGGS